MLQKIFGDIDSNEGGKGADLARQRFSKYIAVESRRRGCGGKVGLVENCVEKRSLSSSLSTQLLSSSLLFVSGVANIVFVVVGVCNGGFAHLVFVT